VRRLAGARFSGDYDRVRPRYVVIWSTALVLVLATSEQALGAAAAARVSIQPLDGAIGSSLRQQIARLVRGHGFQVVTSIPRVDGTGQYLALARDHRLTAFFCGDLEEHRTRQTLTLLVWDGAEGSVLGRWSASGPARQLPKLLAKGFWKHLGSALERAKAPPSDTLAPAPPLRIDASAVD
jgi:hypothetical protein